MTAVDLSHYVTPAGDGTAHLDLAVEGIDCAACIGDIEGGLKKLPGVVAARVNYTLRRVGVDWREGALEPASLVDALGRLGYQAHPFAVRTAESVSDAELKRLLRSLAIAGFAAMNIMLLSVSVWAGGVTDITPETRDFFHWLSALIALPAAAFAGQPFFASAFKALRNRRTNMDVPITIGVTLALGVSLYETAVSAEHAYFDSAIMLLFFLLAGRTLDNAMRRKTRAAAGNLAAFKAETAERLTADGPSVTVPAAALSPGDAILVRPGERIAADGVVLSGHSEIDESLVTGETVPRGVRLGDAVYAGTLNRDGTLTIAVSAAAGGSLVDEVERLLDKAGEARSRRVVLADRAARALRSGRPPHCRALGGGLAACRGGAPSGRDRRDHRADHHLSLRPRSCHTGRTGRRRRRPFPTRRLPQCRRCDRASGGGRHHRLRQDRHAHFGRASCRQCFELSAGAGRAGGSPGPVEPPSAGARACRRGPSLRGAFP